MKTPAAARSDVIRIGVLARMSGCSVPTIRYYEEVGLIPPASRRSSGHRVYDAGAVRRLAFIRRCRDFDQTRALVALSHGADRDCVEARDLAQEQLKVVRAKMLELMDLERSLARFVESCNATCLGGSAPKCTILKDLGLSAETAERGGCCL
jgi:MerR family transcriptional regulator, copper efflux regulator